MMKKTMQLNLDFVAWPFRHLKRGHYGVILADPPWSFNNVWNSPHGVSIGATAHYPVMSFREICDLPVADLAADDCVLFLWVIWCLQPKWNELLEAWGFEYKTCAFDWIKADVSTIDLFPDAKTPEMGLGFWTRQNSEPCLLATKGSPKRLSAAVRQGIIAPRRQHSRKPDGVHERIESLVAGPYVELFARQKRPGWDCWGNETERFSAAAD